MAVPEHILARRMLANRKHSYSISYFYRVSLRRYAISIVIHSALIGLAVSLEMYSLALFAAGLVAGAFFRDLGWFLSIRRTWPFTEKVIDWQKVEELAGEDVPI